ncbi:hypothetical protein H4219_003306 [Mycoemilia scoparia]|uniref:Glucose-6-phosphate 1-epimerase n=1 Tax=Mycoemilia scoparia TaxID=417184 RepID=A0A9W7ZVZ2_9FUNG|nr:hypothetical protein H4219_003306 [Mycoemilia scoparia]
MAIELYKNDGDEVYKVKLTAPNDAECVIYTYGATVTSWKVQGKELLFVSKLAKLDGTKAIRGGIPIVFPQFGPGKLPQHGFARNTNWKVVDQDNKTGDMATVHFELTDSEATRASEWPYRFRLLYKVTLTGTTLSTIIEYENLDSSAFDFTTLMHTYFRTSDVAGVKVKGLDGIKYVDKILGQSDVVETRKDVIVDKNEDRVYVDVPGEVLVDGVGSEDGRVIVKRFNYKDIVFWNPWEEKAKEMSDFGDDEYKEMVCVEAGSVAKPVSLEPGSKWVGGQLLRLAPKA